MQSVGKRDTHPLDRYNLSQQYQINSPTVKLDLTMSETEDKNRSMVHTHLRMNITQE